MKLPKLNKQKLLYYFPRIGGLVYVLFLLVFSFDAFTKDLGFWEAVGLFFLHSVPSIILFIVIMASWKHELVGAIAFLFFGIGYSVMVCFNAPNLLVENQGSILMVVLTLFTWILTIALPPILIGLCFLLGYRKKKRGHVSSY